MDEPTTTKGCREETRHDKRGGTGGGSDPRNTGYPGTLKRVSKTRALLLTIELPWRTLFLDKSTAL